MNDPRLEAQFLQARRTVAESMHRTLVPAAIADSIQFATDALRSGRADWALEVLEVLKLRAPAEPLVWEMLGVACREEQQMPESLEAFARAVALQPDGAQSAVAYAETAAACGLPAAHLFADAQALAPQYLHKLRAAMQAAAQTMPTHRQYIDQHCRAVG
jgi:predicted Zn-dependent protease